MPPLRGYELGEDDCHDVVIPAGIDLLDVVEEWSYHRSIGGVEDDQRNITPPFLPSLLNFLCLFRVEANMHRRDVPRCHCLGILQCIDRPTMQRGYRHDH